jgi:hypothetical protein
MGTYNHCAHVNGHVSPHDGSPLPSKVLATWSSSVMTSDVRPWAFLTTLQEYNPPRRTSLLDTPFQL